MPSAAREDFAATVATLIEADPDLARLVAAHGVPDYWLRPTGFASLVLYILEQQVSLASAAACYARLLARAGVMAPSALLALSPEDTRADGVSRQKDRYLRALAEAIDSGQLDLDELEHVDDDEVSRRLIALPGIGAWTVDVYLLASLDRPDRWPIGDRALQVGVAEALGLEQVPVGAELVAIGERWRPYRSAAARLLWHGYLVRRGRVETPLGVFGAG